MDEVSLLLKLADFGVAAMAIWALFLVLNLLARMIDRLDRLHRADLDQIAAIESLADEVRARMPDTRSDLDRVVVS